MSTPARRRLMRDYKRVMLDPPAGIIAQPEKEDLLQWTAVIFGPDDTPWEGGTFKLVMKFLEEYPNKPPVVKFVTKLFHPNIYAGGEICLDILSNQWSPIYDVAAILASIQSLLTDPNPNSPANVEAAKLYVENRREYDRKVSEVIEGLWKLEQAEAAENGEDDEEPEEADADADGGAEAEQEDPDAAPRKKQKLTENTSRASNAAAPAPAATAPSTETSSAATSSAAAPSAASAASASASAPTPAAATQ